jgi:NAD(P)-dependent dehydrogenase (short-subunit alcohol dehydrogenase family)
MMRDLDGKAIIVTGAGGGIGRASAVALGRLGARLLLVGRNVGALEECSAEIRAAGASAHVAAADVSRAAEVRGFVDLALERFGAIDGLFNNAGIEGPIAHLVDYPEDAFDEVFAVNVRGMFLGLRYALPVMLAKGKGAVVNTGSLASERGLPGTGAYNASKHAVVGLTRTAAAEVGPKGVRVNAVLPGMVETRMLRSIAGAIFPGDIEGGMREMAQVAPLRRYGQPEEIATVVCFLLSDAASFVNGVAWAADGGALATMGNGG